MSDQEYDESALLEESGGENEIETETNEGQVLKHFLKI